MVAIFDAAQINAFELPTPITTSEIWESWKGLELARTKRWCEQVMAKLERRVIALEDVHDESTDGPISTIDGQLLELDGDLGDLDLEYVGNVDLHIRDLGREYYCAVLRKFVQRYLKPEWQISTWDDHRAMAFIETEIRLALRFAWMKSALVETTDDIDIIAWLYPFVSGKLPTEEACWQQARLRCTWTCFQKQRTKVRKTAAKRLEKFLDEKLKLTGFLKPPTEVAAIVEVNSEGGTERLRYAYYDKIDLGIFPKERSPSKQMLTFLLDNRPAEFADLAICMDWRGTATEQGRLFYDLQRRTNKKLAAYGLRLERLATDKSKVVIVETI